MPELPEVETIRRGLDALLVGKTIKKITAQNPKSFIGDSTRALNLSVKSLHRRGKALLIYLDSDLCLLVHLRMTGQLIFVPASTKSSRFAAGHPTDSFLNHLPDRHTRVQITFTDNSNLFFNDQRKFGFIKLFATPDLQIDKFLASLGPEPLAHHFTPSQFYKQLQKRPKTTIKATLLDQTVVAGVGNIYADEALFHAKVHPSRLVATIAPDESAQILTGVRRAMTAALDSGGSTLSNYRKPDGTSGNYLDLFAQVYAKTNHPCPRCSTPITKIRVAGRGTHVCPNCQKP